MRHVLANIFTYALIASLVVGAVLFAWARSEQLVIAQEKDIEPGARDSMQLSDWMAFGERTYVANCQNCHTADGSGRGMYPPVQRMSAHLAASGGRDYLVDLVLHGVYTSTYGAPMPPMPELSNAEIAAVTNYILVRFAADGEAPQVSVYYTEAEVAERRNNNFSEWEMAARRPAIASARELGRGVRPGGEEDLPAVPAGEEE